MAVSHAGALLIGMTEYVVDTGVRGRPLRPLRRRRALRLRPSPTPRGQATIALADPPAEPMTLTLTVTAYNMVHRAGAGRRCCRPTVRTWCSSRSTVLDADGDGDGVLDVGETVDLDVMLENVGVDDGRRPDRHADERRSRTSSIDVRRRRPTPTSPRAASPQATSRSRSRSLGDAPDGHLAEFTLHGHRRRPAPGT